MEEKQLITIVDGKVITINGVKEILGFDENIVIMNTSNGKLTVEGNELKIDSLEKENGKLIVRGGISGVFSSEAEAAKKGFFARFFTK